MGLPDNWVGAKDRVAKFCGEHKESGAIKTEVTIYPDKDAALIKASVFIKGELRATGHALADLKEDKALEKGETAAVGRALEFVGYASLDVESAATPAPERTSTFGKKLEKSKKVAEPNLAKAEAAAPTTDTETEGDSEDLSDQNLTSAAAENLPEEKQTAAPPTKMADLMKKYGAGKINAPTTSLRR